MQTFLEYMEYKAWCIKYGYAPLSFSDYVGD